MALMNAIITNQKAGFDYDLVDKYEAGLELLGFEVKTFKAGQASIVGSRVVIRGGEAYLLGATIFPYQTNNTPVDYDKNREIKLLLTKKELRYLAEKANERGLTIVPISIYNKNGKLKVTIAVAKGRKKYDKREVLKKRDTKRQIDRTLKSQF
jgi:SsrA-binding protein